MRKVVIARWSNLSTISVLGVSVAVIALLLAGRSAVADNKCKNIAGKAFPVAAELDSDPQTTEFAGDATGSFKGRVEVTEFVTIPAGRPETPKVLFFNEVVTFFTEKGDKIKTIGQGAFDPTTGRWGEILSTVEVNGKARDDFGQMYMTGVFNPDAKRFEAEYHGELCHE